MTELTTYQTPAVGEITYGTPLGTQLIAAAVEQMAGAHQLGTALAGTAFVPKHFQGKPDDVTAAIMYGAAIGLDPMSAVRSIYVVSGTPGLYARSMVAVAMSKGHKIWTEDTTDEAVTVAGQRRGSDVVERVTWTIDRATKAGYTSNAKYKTDPQAMLWARAAGDVARRIAPDALAGLDYSVEELQVIDHVEDAPRPRRESAASLLPAPESVEAPAMGGTPDAASAQQVTAIYAGMGDLGYDRATAKEVAAKIIGGPALVSMKDLTRDQASLVLDAVAARKAALPQAAEAESFPNDEYSETLPVEEGN